LPGLVPLAPFEHTDVGIWLEGYAAHLEPLLAPPAEMSYVSSERGPSGNPVLQVWRLAEGRGFRFLYADGTEFVVDAAGASIGARWPASMTLEDMATYLLGPILGFVLRLRGVTCLHASAVVAGEHAIALCGPPGAGKSTTAAALALRGCPVLSDDIVALDERGSHIWAHPGYPRLNVWPDSAAALFGSCEELPLITPGWEKRFVDLARPPYSFRSEATCLRAIYFLRPDDTGPAAPQVSALAPRTALMMAVANTYASYLLDSAMRAREFQFLGRALPRVTLRQVAFSTRPESFSRLPGAILEDAASLGAGSD
jgi:hypothetical protein